MTEKILTGILILASLAVLLLGLSFIRALNRMQKLMRDYEEKLNLVEKFHARIEIYDKMKSYGFEEINQLVIQLEKNEE